MGRYTPALAAALADAAGTARHAGPRCRLRAWRPDPGTAGRLGPGNVAGIDPAPQFAAACRGRNPGADVRTGVAEQLPWPAAHFDAALSCLVIGFMHDPSRALREMAPVTRPGGTVAACMWAPAPWDDHAADLLTAARQVSPPHPAGGHGRHHQGDIARLRRQAGLQHVTSGFRPAMPTTPASTTSGNLSPSPSARPATTCARCPPASRPRSGTPAAPHLPDGPFTRLPARGTPAAWVRPAPSHRYARDHHGETGMTPGAPASQPRRALGGASLPGNHH